MRAWIAVFYVVASGSAGAVECRLDGPAWIVGRAGAGRLAGAVDARIGESIAVFVVAPGRLDGKRVLFSSAPGPRYAPWPDGCGGVVRWRRVEPHMDHQDTPSPNRGMATYSNAVLFGPKHGTWIGYDRIEYFASPLGEARGAAGWTRTLDDARPSTPALDLHGGLGVMRLAAEVIGEDGSRAATPGETDYDGPGISSRVFRYSFRSGDGFLGWLTSFYNVPYLFGSAGHRERAQAERYVGADCADVLTAALRRAGRRDLDYTSVSDFVRRARRVAGPVLVDGNPGSIADPETAVVGEGAAEGPDAAVRPGDLLVIDYVGWDGTPRDWDHVLVFVEDRGPDGKPDGKLGPDDLVADAGDDTGLNVLPLSRQGKVRLLVLRFDRSPSTRARRRDR